MRIDLKGKRVVITGASSGIGSALASETSARGGHVALIARRADRLEAVAVGCRAKGVEARVIQADLSLEADCRRAMAECGPIDILILNAGIAHRGPVGELTDWSLFLRLMQTNYLGPVYCALAALPKLKSARGRLVIVSSLQGKMGFPGSAAYSASKHALHGFFDSLRFELDGSGVGIVIACPGAVASEIRAARGDREAEGAQQMSAEECARLILDATERGDRELWMTAAGKLGVLLRPFMPGFVESAVRRRVAKFYAD